MFSQKEYVKQWAQRIKQEVLQHYGGACACCKESRLIFLALDHVDGGGDKHRHKVGWGTQFYRWIIKNEFPNGYRVLCHNCNFAIRMGECPHNGK